MAASGGCAQLIGADWSSYDPGEGGPEGGGAGGSTAGGGGAGGLPAVTAVSCTPDARRCLDDGPQRCGDEGEWEDAAPCPAAAPACDGGECVPPSCVGLAKVCGPSGDESCCASAEAVPEGTFNRSNDSGAPATVSGFQLDRFEVTVGRFRKFVEAYDEEGVRPPAAGAGAHPKIPGSGWDPAWDDKLPEDAAALRAAANCDPERYEVWTDEAADHERLPMTCLSWYVAFAFCAWDGGRLPTEAEWNYAAAGGDEQREYPWSDPAESTEIDGSFAVYKCTGDGNADDDCPLSDIQPVGSRSPKGDGRWGHADLAGSMWEWTRDTWSESYSGSCEDCANLESGSERVIRGGAWYRDWQFLLTWHRNHYEPSILTSHVGVRCARTP
ncbi:formylglycine-generating enzyme family protein [Sorangium sp. So ce131]|uniref:formylglycine-generating enzyme family protein n=1 Tax=Sorangium sp. So ce131 TaxID=3133282 RepID=UPI003F621DC7